MADFLYAHAVVITALFFCAVLLCLGIYFLCFARALAPKRGTLEWIALYDRPGLGLSGSAFPFRPLSLIPGLVAAILSAAIYCLAVCLQMRSFLLLTAPQGVVLLLSGALTVALTAAGGFALLQNLFGETALSFAGALLLGLELGADYAAAACFAWSLMFLHRWMSTDFEKKARSGFFPLICLALMLSLSVTLETNLTPAALTFTLGVIAVALLRFRRTHRLDRFRGLIGTLIVFCFTFALGVVLLQAGLALLGGNAAVLQQPAFYLRALTAWFVLWGKLPAIPLFSPAVNLPLILAGLIGAAFSVYDAWRYGRPQGLILALAAVGGLLTCLLCGVYLHGAALIPAVVYTFARCKQRGAVGLMASGLIGAFLMSLLYALMMTNVI